MVVMATEGTRLTPKVPESHGGEGQPQPVYVMLLNGKRIKTDVITKVTKLTNRNQVHGNSRNMSNIKHKKRRNSKSTSTSNRRRTTISCENVKV